MTKIVYNACFGGFSLSHEAILRYAEIKGLKLYPESTGRRLVEWFYWTVPPEKRLTEKTSAEFTAMSIEDRCAYNKAYDEQTLNDRDIPRADPALAQVVEELGDAANGMCAKLRIAEIPAGTQYRIDEYDGRESVDTRDSYDWLTA